MRILFLTVNLGGGGAEKVLVNLANQLADRGYDITVRSLTDTGVNKAFLNENVKYEYLFKSGFPGMGKLYMLPQKLTYRMVAHGEYDIIIPYLQGVLTRVVANAPKTQKKIAWLHADMGGSLSLFKVDELADVWGKYSHIVAVSKVAKESFEKLSGIRDRTRIIYNTFDVDGIREKSKENMELFKDNHGKILCSVGKLDEVKGYPRLLKAVKHLNDNQIDCSLIIVGEGSQRAKLEKYIKENRMEGYVRLVGFDANPYKYIAHSDLFVCSSYTEGFSSVVAESLILGVPVLTTDCSGMREMLGENNEYGMVVENSEEGLFEGLKKLLAESDMLEHYSEKAKERSSFFEPEASVGAVETLFREVMEGTK